MSSQQQNVIQSQPEPERTSQKPVDAVNVTVNTVPVLAGYTFVQGLESQGGDAIRIETTDLTKLKEYCDAHPECVGFNTNGWVKSSFKPQSEWLHISDDAKVGTYIKNAPVQQPVVAQQNVPVQQAVPVQQTVVTQQTVPVQQVPVQQPVVVPVALEGYIFVQGLDSQGNEVDHNTKDLQALKAYCDTHKEFLGFNTNGKLKTVFKPRAEWTKFSDSPAEGTYVRTPATTLSAEEKAKVLETNAATLKKEEAAFIKKEKTFLDESFKFLDNFLRTSQDFITQEQANIKKLTTEAEAKKPELEKINTVVEENRAKVKDTEAKILTANQQQDLLTGQRNEIVDKITFKELDAIKIKDGQAASNDVFKWVYQTVYKEPRDTYSLKSFKKVLGKNKGKDLAQKLKDLPFNGFQKDDIAFGQTVIARQNETIAELETKKKENASLRNLFNYISNIVQVANFQDQVFTLNQQLGEEKKALDAKLEEQKKVNEVVTSLNERVAASNYYIESLTKLKPLLQANVAETQNRVAVENKQLEVIKGNPEAVKAVETLTQDKPVVVEQKQTVQTETVKKSQVPEKVEEENFGGDSAQKQASPKKVESKAPTQQPAIELKESQFAGSKGSCESCGIF